MFQLFKHLVSFSTASVSYFVHSLAFLSQYRVLSDCVSYLRTDRILPTRSHRYCFFPMPRLLLQSSLLLILLTAPAAHLRAIPSFADEYQLKAVFLYNFANFISWPERAFASADTPFLICILGSDPFGEHLDSTVKDQQARERFLKITRLSPTQLSQVSDCHILFISNLENTTLTDIYRLTCRYPILTVSEDEQFIDSGGMIRFYNLNKRVRLEINPEAIEQVGLKADANLLNLSKITRASLAICPE